MLGRRDKGVRARTVRTVNGDLPLERHYYWAKGQEGVCPADAALGIDSHGVSPGAREALSMMGLANNFRDAAAAIRRLTGLSVGCEFVRLTTHREAARVTAGRQDGTIQPSFAASQATTGTINHPGPTRLYLGVDGVLAPLVTQAEKDKRRVEHQSRRRARTRQGLINAKSLPARRVGSDQRYKEMKLGFFYDQDGHCRHVFATAENHEGFGALLKRESALVGFAKVQERLSLTDGADWIKWTIYNNTPTLTARLLDFYHLAQHIYATSLTCMGDTPAAKAWSSARLSEFKHKGAADPLGAIRLLTTQTRSPAKRQSLRQLTNYITQRLDMLAYPKAKQRGWDIGSGPTEAMCKNLTLRLKHSGMKWDAINASNLMNLIALYESRQATTYWTNPPP